MRPMQAIGNFAVKHPNVYAGVSGSIDGAVSGALLGGIVGGIRDDETFLGGAGKGALIGAGAGAAIKIPRMHMLAKSQGRTLSGIYEESFDAMNALSGYLQGLGHDGIGIS